MVELSAGDPRYRDDHGDADPAVAAALADYAAGEGGEHAVLAALTDSRLLVPVVAVRSDEAGQTAPPAVGTGEPAEDKTSEMAMPTLIGRDGRRAIPAFTSLDAVQRWRADARPVPVAAISVWQAAVQEASAVVIDIAGPVPLSVEGSRLAALAGGQVPGMHEDSDVWQRVAAAAGEVAPGVRVRLSPPRGGLDFTLELAPPAGQEGLVPEDVADRVAAAVHDSLSDRVRSGIAVLRRPGG